MLQHDSRWTTAQLESRGTVYKDSSYECHMVTEQGEEINRYLFPGEMWGVLRGLDVGLNLEHIPLQVPDGQRKVFSQR